MSLVGFHGLRSVACRSHQNTTRLIAGLTALDGIERLFEGGYFHEVALRLDRPVEPVLETLAERNILGGFDLQPMYPDLGNALLVCATETKTDADIEAFITTLGEVLAEGDGRPA